MDSGADPVTPVSKRSCVFVAALVFAWTCLAFWPALSAGFVDWDDEQGLVHNRHFRSFGVDSLSWMFTTFLGGHYQPLTWLSFALDHALWGMNPRGYHLQNLLWHGLAAVMFFLVARRVLASAGVRAGSCLAAGFAALLFGVHPLRVESVAWVTERRDVLSGAALLATVWLYLRWVDRRGKGTHALMMACFAVSLLGKAWGMSLPVVLLLLDCFPLRRTRQRGAWRGLVLEKIPFFALAGAAAWIAGRAQLSTGAAPGLDVHGVGQRVAQAAYGLCFYPWKTFLPLDLSPVYPLRWGFDPWQPVFVSCGLAVLGVLALAWKARRCCPAFTVSVAVYVVVVSPVLGLLQTGPQITADRYSYLSCLSLALLLSGVWARAYAASAHPRRWIVGALVVLAIATMLTVRQSTVWRDSESLWRQAVAVHPDDAEAHYRLGRVLLEQRDEDPSALDEARRTLQRAADLFAAASRDGIGSELEDDTDVALAWCVFFAEDRTGRPRRVYVRQQFERVVARWPDSAQAHLGLGIALGVEGQLARAESTLKRALQLDPTIAEAHVHLGRLYASFHKRDRARHHLEEALRLQPDNAEARGLLRDLGS